MHIFLDESGSFGGIGSDRPAVSVQGALILPSHRLPKLFRKYENLRRRLPKRNGEVKGSLLNEIQIADVIELLHKNEAIFCATMIDMAEHSDEDIEQIRLNGINALSANLTDQNTNEIRENIEIIKIRISKLSRPLYVQMLIIIDLIHDVLEQMIGYHCQRNPKELNAFHWLVDAKQPNNVTDWEDLWRNTLPIWMQAISINRPGRFLSDGDYRHFQRFIFNELPSYLAPHVRKPPSGAPAAIDLQLLLKESFQFSAEPEPGLEMVDIVTNALRRALNGNLQPNGWLPLRSLMIHRPDLYVRPVGLMKEEGHLSKTLSTVLNQFRTGGRRMVVPSAYSNNV